MHRLSYLCCVSVMTNFYSIRVHSIPMPSAYMKQKMAMSTFNFSKVDTFCQMSIAMELVTVLVSLQAQPHSL